MNDNLEVPMWEKKPSMEETQNGKNVIPQFPRKQRGAVNHSLQDPLGRQK